MAAYSASAAGISWSFSTITQGRSSGCGIPSWSSEDPSPAGLSRAELGARASHANAYPATTTSTWTHPHPVTLAILGSGSSSHVLGPNSPLLVIYCGSQCTDLRPQTPQAQPPPHAYPRQLPRQRRPNHLLARVCQRCLRAPQDGRARR